MKVYELMNMLSEANAGAEVKVSFCLSVEDVLKADEVDRDGAVFTKEIEGTEHMSEWQFDLIL